MPRLKHCAFKEEQEWRIVVTHESSIKFRMNRLGIAPYIEFSSANDAAKPTLTNFFVTPENIYMPKMVTVGPCENQMLAKIGIEQLFKGTGKFISDVSVSKLPYRHMRK